MAAADLRECMKRDALHSIVNLRNAGGNAPLLQVSVDGERGRQLLFDLRSDLSAQQGSVHISLFVRPCRGYTRPGATPLSILGFADLP